MVVDSGAYHLGFVECCRLLWLGSWHLEPANRAAEEAVLAEAEQRDLVERIFRTKPLEVSQLFLQCLSEVQTFAIIDACVGGGYLCRAFAFSLPLSTC